MIRAIFVGVAWVCTMLENENRQFEGAGCEAIGALKLATDEISFHHWAARGPVTVAHSLTLGAARLDLILIHLFSALQQESSLAVLLPTLCVYLVVAVN